MVYASGTIWLTIPYREAVSAVMGPMLATTTPCRSACASSPTRSRKYVTVDELVNVTA